MAGVSDGYDDILKLIRSNQNRTYYNLSVQVDIDGELYEPVKVTQLYVAEDYANNYTADVHLSMVFTADVYYRQIYPRRKHAKVILKQELQSELYPEAIPGTRDLVKVYRMVDKSNEDVDMQGMPNIAMDQALITVDVALLELSIEQLRLVRVQGGFSDTRAIDVLRYYLGVESDKLQLPSNLKPRGVDYVEPDVTDPQSIVILRPGTELLSEAPVILQRDNGGIYNHGINIFMKNNQWFIYPLFNTNRYDKATKVIEMVILPPNVAPGIERTYTVVDGTRLLISVTGDVKQSDQTDILYQNLGNGVQFSKASALWDYVKTAGNRSVANPEKNIAKFMSVSRQTKIQNLPISDRPVTDNMAREISKLSARRGYEMAVVWQNSNPDQLRPGMPVRLHVPMEGGMSREHYAVLLSVESNTAPDSPEMTATRYSTNSVLSLFVAI